jgi:hypothetical protein
MNPLHDLEHLGFRVGWRTALVGWDGPAANERQVDGQQIVELAVSRLSRSPSLQGAALELASLEGHETEEIDRLLRELAHREHASEELELRKWRFLLLQRCLDALSEDPLYTWIALAEFWQSFGNPGDCPEIIRSFEERPPTARFTTESRQELVSDHQRWLATEHTAISSTESQV